MGEKIKDLAEFNIGDLKINIELNSSYYKSEYFDVHLQCDKGRIGLTDREFLQLATCFMVAKKQFLHYKEMNKNE